MPEQLTSSFAAATGQLPAIAGPFSALYRSFWSLESVPAVTLELCRLRVAQLLGSELAWQHEEIPLSSEQREQLSRWPGNAAFSEAQKACLEVAEMHAMDARSITDDQVDAVKHHYGEVGFVALIQALGVFDAMTRLGLIWGLNTQEIDAS